MSLKVKLKVEFVKEKMMKIDHAPVMKEQAVAKHEMHEDATKAHEAGHKPHHNFFKEHSAGHKLHHEHVKTMCMGGKA